MEAESQNERVGQDNVAKRVKILSIGNFGTGWDGSICDEQHIAKALEDMGHSVVRWSREMTQYFPSDAEYKGADFALIAQYQYYPDDLMKKIRDLGRGPKVYMAFDYQEDGQEWHEKLKKDCDLYLSKPLRDMQPNWQWWSQDFSPDFLDKPLEEPQKDIDVLFTGSWVPWESGQERVKTLKAIDEKFNLQINSVTPDQWREAGFKNVQGPVMDLELTKLYSRAKINFSMDHVYSPGYWSDRNAQIMACGGFVLFRYVPLSEARFDDNIAFFYNTEDCLEKIAYYLENEREREQMAEKGYFFAQQHLMCHNRVKDLLTIVENYL